MLKSVLGKQRNTWTSFRKLLPKPCLQINARVSSTYSTSNLYSTQGDLWSRFRRLEGKFRPDFRNQSNGKRPRDGRRRLYVGLGLLLAGESVYAAFHLERTPYTGRLRMMDITRETEHALGDISFDSVLENYKDKVMPESSKEFQRIKRIGNRISESVQKTKPELIERFNWRFAVIEEDGIVNALCAPGGKIIVFTGLLKLADSDDELSAIIAHEVSHALLRHSAERISLAKILLPIQIVLSLFFDFGLLSILLTRLFISLPWSRKMETEADTVGLEIMTDACFDPEASTKIFLALKNKVESTEKSSVQEFLSTHPIFSARIEALEKGIPEKTLIYQDNCEIPIGYWSDFDVDESESK